MKTEALEEKSKKDGSFSTKMKSFLNKDNVAGHIFSAPFIIGFLGFTIIPMVFSMYYSFTDYNMVQEETFIGAANYVRLFSDERFHKSLIVTLIYVGVSVPVKLAFALFVAYLLTRKVKGETVYRSLFYVPSLIGGSIAVALVWKELFSRRGLVNNMLRIVGLTPISWFGDQDMAMIPLILISAWQFGSSMIIFAAGLKEIPNTYYEAAIIDGANKVQMFFKITLPLLSPIILFNLIMQTISAFMAFTQAFVITGGGPNDATNFYALYVYNHAFSYYNMGYASAMSWIMLIIIGFITFLILKFSKYWTFTND
ncbi:carbohydrate ABC transporter permease [Jeotgalibaca caeni]|uniref:carbohydrate ABC transporter permease n=1 Tax=Jeotgalibaca caeni TaxID=3028623 RepID=UPI00237D73FD|nr:sugar ABC transporter permease [Jeotgalibaca caeni]MDE1548820.1 sugar ABC transporter permease [Jeotgalibaca caeni]